MNELIARRSGVLLSAVALGSLLTACTPQLPPPDGTDQIALQQVVSGIPSPVALADPADGTARLLVVSQSGEIWVVQNGQALDTPLLDLSDRLPSLNTFGDERGLLGLALHPDFAENGRFYVYYSVPPSAASPAGFDSETLVCEFTVQTANPNLADLASEKLLLRLPQPQANHKGGALAFGPDGYLYISTGDGGGAGDEGLGHTEPIGNAQDLTSRLGKILRIDVDGGAPYAVPADNPFINVAGAAPEIFALGFRNPWRMGFDRQEGDLFVADVGQTVREEVNIVELGGNYGWRIREGSTCFNRGDFESPLPDCDAVDAAGRALIDPILEYGRDDGLSAIGGYVYRGAAIPGLAGRYVFGDFTTTFVAGAGRLFVADRADDGSWSFNELTVSNRNGGRLGEYLYAFGEDAAGELYVLSNDSVTVNGRTGSVYKIVPAE